MANDIKIMIKYFARFREQLGCEEESITLEEHTLVSQLISILAERKGPWALVFKSQNAPLIALNQEVSNSEAILHNGDELAFYPPVTGG